MASTVTVTGKIGPGDTLTSTQFTGVTQVLFDCDNEILQVNYNMLQGPKIAQIDISAVGTITATASTTNNNYTFTLS